MTLAIVKHKGSSQGFMEVILSHRNVYMGTSIGGFKLEPTCVGHPGVVMDAVWICFGGVCLQVFLHKLQGKGELLCNNSH
jgi:hypothetical protein